MAIQRYGRVFVGCSSAASCLWSAERPRKTERRAGALTSQASRCVCAPAGYRALSPGFPRRQHTHRQASTAEHRGSRVSRTGFVQWPTSVAQDNPRVSGPLVFSCLTLNTSSFHASTGEGRHLEPRRPVPRQKLCSAHHPILVAHPSAYFRNTGSLFGGHTGISCVTCAPALSPYA